MNVLETLFRNIFFVIDNGIYFLVSSAYNLVTELSKTSILRRDVINDFAQRIYFFIAIFMLFKIAVSLINYFITPENFNDSKVGMGGVLKRIIVSLVLIVAVPVVFEQAYNLQQIVIEKNILASVFFGETSDEENAKRVFHDGGDIISIELFKAFFTPNKEEYDDTYDTATYVSDMQPLITKGSSGEYDYEYRLPLTSLAGGFAAWVLVMFCFDVAVRSIKLSFLQLIAPIPIISYIEPKKGDKIFNQWVSDCVSTYLSVFIRLVALYFVMYIIAELSANNWALFNLAGDSQVETSPLAYVFVILGLLLFMKEAPKLIMNILGIKDSGGFTLNPLKKLQETPGLSRTLGGAAAFAGGAIANAAYVRQVRGMKPEDRTEEQEQLLTRRGAAGSIAAGAFSSAYRAATQEKGGFLARARQGITDSSNRRNLRRDQGYGLTQQAGDTFTTLAGIKYKTGTTSELKNRLNAKKQQLANSKVNEQAILTALNQKIANAEPHTAALLNTFSGAIDPTTGATTTTDYARYVEEELRLNVPDFDQLDEAIKQNRIAYEQQINQYSLDEQGFAEINDIFNARVREDHNGRAIEKEIESIESSMNKIKERKGSK